MTPKITDEYMQQMRDQTHPYTIMLLRKTTTRSAPGADAIVWEHGRRNHALRADGRLAIVCPIRDHEDWAGLGIFTTTVEETRVIMEQDPGVKAGIFTYELIPTRSFPGDALPA
jgi:hypothetical protein